MEHDLLSTLGEGKIHSLSEEGTLLAWRARLGWLESKDGADFFALSERM